MNDKFSDQRRDKPMRNPASQMVVGLFIVIVGTVFLLANLGWLDLDFTLHLWPTALIFFGILKVLQTRSTSGAVVGGALILVGGLILLREIGFISVRWHTLWPLLLIVAGLSAILRSGGKQPLFFLSSDPVELSTAENVINVTAVMGGFKRRITTPDFRGGEITALMGGCDLDLRLSSINGEAVLNVFSMFGGVTIKVPVDWTVILQGTPIMGGFEEKTVPAATPDKRLIVRGYAIMGGLEVRN